MANGDPEKTMHDAVRSLTGQTEGLLAEELLRAALRASGSGVLETMESLNRQLDQLRRASQAESEAVEENTEAIRVSTASQSASTLSQAARIARGSLGGFGVGLTLSPLLSGLLGLFGRGKKEELPTLTQYVRPPSVHFTGMAPTEAGGAFLPVDYEAGGIPRTAPAAAPAQVANVTVQVNAIDSRSFLDYSDEIARAVRQAMLNAHALNDVVNEL